MHFCGGPTSVVTAAKQRNGDSNQTTVLPSVGEFKCHITGWRKNLKRLQLSPEATTSLVKNKQVKTTQHEHHTPGAIQPIPTCFEVMDAGQNRDHTNDFHLSVVESNAPVFDFSGAIYFWKFDLHCLCGTSVSGHELSVARFELAVRRKNLDGPQGDAGNHGRFWFWSVKTVAPNCAG